MIEPIAYQKKLEGKSNAHLITFNDGKDYVVKFLQRGFEKTLANEWISYCLGRYLGLPIPFAQFVEIPHDFSLQNLELAELGVTQYQFASLYIPNCLDGHQVPPIFQITNDQSLASIIIFDYWLCNGDRTRKNILLHETSEKAYQLWAIDHAEVFGTYNWLLSDLEKLPAGLIKSATHQMMARFIKDENTFDKQLELINTMPIFLIEEIVSTIPEDWMVSREEKKEIVHTLLNRRKKILPGTIQLFINKIYRPLHKLQE
jgi:hypothetical protein